MSGNRAWVPLISGPEAEVDAAIIRQRQFDPDLWVIELDIADAERFAAEILSMD